MHKVFIFLISFYLVSFFPTMTFSSDKVKKVFFIGDSLSAGYGVEEKESYPSLIEERLKKDFGDKYKVVNSSVSGSTSASASSRIKWILKANPHLVVVALGANDALRGVEINSVKNNLEKALKQLEEKKVKYLLVGMLAPPNYGESYTRKFKKMYHDLAKELGTVFVPFLLKDVAGEKEYNQADGIHPNAKGHQIMAETVYPYLKKAL